MARVLLVDDDPGFRDTTARRLEVEGHDVVAVPDADAALDQAGRRAFDVAVLEVQLSGTDGLALLRRMRADASTRDLPVIFYTAHWSAELAAEGLSLADAYLTKGQSLGRLLDTIGDLTADGSARPPGVSN